MVQLLLPIIYISFISLGLPDSLLGSAWPTMYPQLGVPFSYAGILSMIISLGTIVSSLNSDRLTRALGTGKVTALSVAMTTAALFGFSVSTQFWMLCLWAVPYGLGAGSVDAALNNYVALHYKSRHMSWLHCMWGLGASGGPVIMGWALAHSSWQSGYRIISVLQVVLTAISLPSYGTDSGTSLAELIEKAAAVPGIERIRLGSLDPDMLHDEDIRRMAAVKKLCPQFHLSLQSGCDKTLRAMRRPYTTAQYAEIADKLREAFGAENVSFTTDVIVGFPGETEEDFEASMAFVTGMRFLKVHVFPYSRREGTAAYDFPDQLPEHEKEARSRRMTAAVEEVRAAEVCAVQGRTASVLLETPLSATMFTGYTRQYLPVLVNAPGCRTGDIVEVTLGEWDGKRCRAAIV